MRTIAAISTPHAPGGIAVIRISGPDALSVADKLFHGVKGVPVTTMEGYTCAYGYVRDGNERLDDVVLTVFRAPHSYTGEDVVEISCHGGIYLSGRILQVIYNNNVEPAEPGEFTKRAFLNGKLSLSQAEAVMDVIRADGDAALRQANEARTGKLGIQMKQLGDRLVHLLSAFAYWLDDAEECPPELAPDSLYSEVADCIVLLQQMLAQYESGRIIREGIRTVLLGLPNAGKSSFMNAVCGMQRSIVTDIAGTTRDVITESVRIGTYKLLLSDTAGIRQAENTIEAIGIEQAKSEAQAADLILYVIDAQQGITDADRAMLESIENQPCILLWNKTDLCDAAPPACNYPIFACSAKEGIDITAFAAELDAQLHVNMCPSVPVPINARQRTLLVSAKGHLDEALQALANGLPLDMLSVPLELAASDLLAIEGTQVTDDVIDGVFANFCVGK